MIPPVNSPSRTVESVRRVAQGRIALGGALAALVLLLASAPGALAASRGARTTAKADTSLESLIGPPSSRFT